jgi:hypothetical protein
MIALSKLAEYGVIMAHPVGRKRTVMIIIGILSIIGLFSYTWVHSGNLLARYITPGFIGFLCAAGIELSIIGLSMRIGELKKSGLNAKFFTATLIAVVAVSAAANIAEGFYVRYNESLTIGNFTKLDIIEACILLAATGLISVVTLALSELIGQDVIAAQKAQQKRGAIASGYEIVPNTPDEMETPPAAPQLTAPQPDKSEITIADEEFKTHMDALGNDAPKSISEVMTMFGLSHATAQRRLARYRGQK